MSRNYDVPFGLFLMERLSERREQPRAKTASLRVLKEAIRHDLEAVLNTRRPMARLVEPFPETRGTVLDYGLEDFSDLHDTTKGHLLAMQQAVERCLAEFEPRLQDVTVNVQKGFTEKRELHLHIEARLPLYPSVETIFFDTVFDLTSQTYLVG